MSTASAQLVARRTSTCSLESSLTRTTKVCIPVSLPSPGSHDFLLLLPSTKLVSTFDLLELSNCDKLCKQGFHLFFRPSLCFLLSGALPHKEGGVDGMETITTDAAQRGVMATGRRPTQLATPRRRCLARTHSSLRVQKSCSGHGRTFNNTLIDKREHGCGRGLRCVRWRGTRSRWRRAKIQALEDVETTCDIRSTSEPTSHVASSVFPARF